MTKYILDETCIRTIANTVEAEAKDDRQIAEDYLSRVSLEKKTDLTFKDFLQEKDIAEEEVSSFTLNLMLLLQTKFDTAGDQVVIPAADLQTYLRGEKAEELDLSHLTTYEASVKQRLSGLGNDTGLDVRDTCCSM